MKAISIVIGSIVVAAIFMAIPILLSASFCLGWGPVFSLIFVIGTLIDFYIVFNFILENSID